MLLQDRELAGNLGRNGRAWVEGEVNWTRAAAEFEASLDKFFPDHASLGKGAV